MFSGCNNAQDKMTDVITNEKIIQSQSFQINSASTKLETSARGTVFLAGKEGVPKQAQEHKGTRNTKAGTQRNTGTQREHKGEGTQRDGSHRVQSEVLRRKKPNLPLI